MLRSGTFHILGRKKSRLVSRLEMRIPSRGQDVGRFGAMTIGVLSAKNYTSAIFVAFSSFLLVKGAKLLSKKNIVKNAHPKLNLQFFRSNDTDRSLLLAPMLGLKNGSSRFKGGGLEESSFGTLMVVNVLSTSKVMPNLLGGEVNVYIQWQRTTVDGHLAPVEVGSLSHHLQGFIHPRWCRISSINSMTIF